MILQQALNEAILHLQSAHISDAEISARFLMEHVLQLDQAKLISESQRKLSEAEYREYQSLINRRAKHEPVAYIAGETTFCNLNLKMDRSVLIPRPETEQLVELVSDFVIASKAWRSKRLLRRSTSRNDHLKITDVGTGSGAIALALADKLKEKDVKITGTDISENALVLAKENARRLGLEDKVSFIYADLLSVILSGSEPRRGPLWGGSSASADPPSVEDSSSAKMNQCGGLRMTNILVANLPYIPSGRIPKLQSEVRDYEPLLALDGGPDGLDHYRKLFDQITRHYEESLSRAESRDGNLKAIFCEIDETHGPLMTNLVHSHWPQANIKIKKDFVGLDRFAQITLLEH